MRERDRPLPITDRRKKMEHFWYYYKVHTLAAFFFVFIILMTIRDCAQNIDPDVSIGYMGPHLTDEQREALVQEWLPLIQDAGGDDRKHIEIYNLSDPRQIVVRMATGDTQLFSFDLDNFSKFAGAGAFQPLDELIALDSIDLDKFPEVRLTAQETSEELVYGLPLADNHFLQDVGLHTEEKYLSLRIPKNLKKPKERIPHENALAILQHLSSVH